MIPELRRMRMYGKFYKEKDLHDQIEDFVAMDEKDIETPEEFENILHKAFINIKKNNRIFLGVIQIEANGFESDPGFGYTLEQNKMQKLMKIHTKRRDKIEFPRLTEESYIEVRYYGKPEVIQFLANQRKQGILEIVEQVQSDKKYSEAVMGGIICTDFEAVYFYILVNNFDNLDSENFESKIDETTYERMVEMIEKAKLTPVSWFRIDFGFQGFDNLFLWEEVKDSIIIETVQEKYQYYLGKLLKTKQREDDIKKRVEQQYDGIADVFSLVNKLEEKSKKEGKLICEKCGEDLPQDSDFCPSCGNQL